MGGIVGVGLVSHVPTIMFDEATRRELNEGREISLVPGHRRLRSEVLDRLQPETIIILDTHWFTTVEHVELGTPTHAEDDEYLPVYYATINLVHYLQTDERFVSVSIVQTGEDDDFLTLGRVIGNAVEASDRRVVILASGGMSHTFHRLKVIDQHEASDPVHIVTPEARAADEERLEWMQAGDHARIIDEMDAYHQHAPEGGFGHFLAMIGAVGGRTGPCVVRVSRWWVDRGLRPRPGRPPGQAGPIRAGHSHDVPPE